MGEIADDTVPDYTVADYLMDRLAELGVDRVFGVPGDFTLALLDHVVAHPRLAWTGCTNELNAGYAADGYGRLRGIAAFTTTFGVGELSAVNALAGSYAEHVPVVEIVGSPGTGAQAAHRIVHHSLGDGVFDHFMHVHAEVTCARAALILEGGGVATALREIDRVLCTVRDLRLPGYLLLPTDVAAAAAAPPLTPLPEPVDPTEDAALAGFAAAAEALIGTVDDLDQVTVLGGLMVHRTGAMDAFGSMLETGALRHATSLWGKSLVDESSPLYLGSYAGAASAEAVRAAVEEAPVLVVAGVQFTDLNSGFFTQRITRERTIELAATVASVGEAVFEPVALPRAVAAVTEIIARRAAGRSALARSPLSADPGASSAAARGQSLDQDSLWRLVADHLRPGDVVLADQGTSFYGMATHRLPRDVLFLGQPLWASIGYTLPALLGACLAAPGRRGILLIGDGAAQMTLTELATLIRAELDVVVVVVDNDGYTVERAIHGADAPYNDIATVDWAGLPAVLGPGRGATGARAETIGELADLLDAATPRPAGLSLIQAVVPRNSVPPLLATLARQAAAANAHRP